MRNTLCGAIIENTGLSITPMPTRKRHVTMLVALTLALLGVASWGSTPDTSSGRPASDFLTGASLTTVGADRVSTRTTTEIARLPLAAQASISQALGRDDGAYHAVADDGDIRAENVRHDLSARFTAAGVEVSSKQERLTLALRAYGYGEALRPVAGAEPQAEANRVVYRRGPLAEWYVNGPLGLEQGFTLDAPPAGPREGPLTLSLAVGGTLDAQLDAEGDGLTFASSGIRYRGLFAMDAGGRDLPGWLELDGGTLALRVDDAGARYPLTIDPFVQQAKLTAGDGAAGDHFGNSVALDGDTALVGAPDDTVGANVSQGSVYVFTRSGGVWTQQAKLTASDGAAGDRFGHSVALSGDTALVSAAADDVGANVNQGSAYVFIRRGRSGVWTEQAQLTASDGAAGDQLGQHVALSGDTALVAAMGDDVGTNVDQGSAYVFTRRGVHWTEEAQLAANDGAASDRFGISVALSGDTALVGADTHDVGANVDQGSAYVFIRSGGGVWTEQAQLTASDGAAFDQFGNSVALSGDTALVGVIFDDVGANVNQGSAYVFTRSGVDWTEEAQLTDSDGAAGDLLGDYVALSGDTALAGAFRDDVGVNVDQGSASVFTRSGGVWTQQAKLTASDGAAADFLGQVALSGNTALVGAPFDDVGANVDQGAAYVFLLAPVPTSQDECRNGGWQTFGVFKNQGDCVSFVLTGEN